MKQLFTSFLLFVLLASCGNDVEEIKDPSTGTVLKRFEYYTDDNGQKIKDGEYTEWRPDGSIRLQETYVDGKREGESKAYVSEDSIFVNVYKNDERNGVCRLEDAKGTVLGTYTYRNDNLNGETVYNYANGKPYLKAIYKDNVPQGEWLYYDEKGKKSAKVTVENGVPQELLGIWQVEGMRMTYFTFNDEKIVTVWEPYNDFAMKPYEAMRGKYAFGRYFKVTFGAGGFEKGFTFALKSLKGDTLVLEEFTTKEEWVLIKAKEGTL